MAQYNVYIARKYKSGNQERTHYWNVGKAFTFTTREGKEGLNIKLYSRTLMTDEFVAFIDEEKDEKPKNAADTPEDDDIPF